MSHVESGTNDHPNRPFPQSVVPENEVRPGDLGDDVERVYQYLRRFGYFPNPHLARSFPSWRPAVAFAPDDPNRFDDRLETAVHLFQRAYHLSLTGSVDRPTLELMRRPRCGVPDNVGPEGLAEFVAHDTRWDGPIVTYNHANFSSDLTDDEERQAIRLALDQWSAVTPLDFQESAHADIEIGFFEGDHGDGADNAFDGAGGVLAHCFYPPSS